MRTGSQSLETRKKISRTLTGHSVPRDVREKISISLSGRKIPPDIVEKNRLGHLGQIRTPEQCANIRAANLGKMLGKRHSIETRLKMSKAHKGEKAAAWRGGTSFEPYCQKFNREFKERVRTFFGFICQECGTPQNGKRLSVHHINFNKMTCCDGTLPLFIPLCLSCHSATNHNREYWEQYFTEMIEDYYGGKCYLTIEEMIEFNRGKP